MILQRNRKLAIAILVSLLTLCAFVPAFNKAEAAEFVSYMTVSPNPVGVNQPVIIIFGFKMPTPSNVFYTGWMLNIMKPDGTNKTSGPYTSDTTGGTNAYFTPTAVGTYRMQAYYPGGNITYPRYGTVPAQTYYVPPTYTPAFELTVQQEQLPNYPMAPLPKDYWQWPIYGDNREWATIGANWLMSGYDTFRQRTGAVSGVFAPYTSAPNSPHVLWTKTWMFGGIIGGTLGTNTYYTGSNYREEVTPPVIINGRLYYNHVDPPAYGFYCVDLYTGETIWYQNQTFRSATGAIVQGTQAQISLGQIVMWNTVNQNGGVPYLWSTSGNTWARYDAFTGNLLNTFVNATTFGFGIGGSALSGAQVFGPNGEFLQFGLDTNTRSLIMWNSSKAVDANYNQQARYNIPWKDGIQWNVSITPVPNEFIMTIDPKNPTIIVTTNQSRGTPSASEMFVDKAYSTTDGHLLWQQTRNVGTWELTLGGGQAMGEGIYVNFRKETMQYYAYDATTGNELWISDPRPNFWGTYIFGTCFAYGKLYASAYDGRVIAYDAKTGKIVWEFYDNSVNPSNIETPYGNYPFYGALVIADGKVFAPNQEHTENSPMYRGMTMYAIDAETGNLTWMINGKYKHVSIAGGYLIAPNMMDGKIYCFGKGQSATTITAPKVAIPLGKSVVIEGTVTDQSPGQKGTACVSDSSMAAWMEYMHMQKPIPGNATGVEVTLDVLDANGNYRNIGKATSDISGVYSFVWQPDIPGKYTIIATFEGTESYGSSFAETAVYVEEAGTTTPLPTVAPTPTATTTPTTSPAVAPGGTFLTTELMLALAAIIIIIIALAAILLFRRKK